MGAIYLSVYGVQAQWTNTGVEIKTPQTNIIFNSNSTNSGVTLLNFGSLLGQNYIKFSYANSQSTPYSGNGFAFATDVKLRINAQPKLSSSGIATTLFEENGNAILTFGNLSSPSQFNFYGILKPQIFQFTDNTTLNSANFLTSITGNSNRIGTITMQITTLSSGLVALQNSLNATNSGLNLRINNLEVLTNNQFATFNTSLNGINTQLNNLNSTFAGINSQLNSQNTSISGLNSQFSSVNSQLNSQNTSISGLNSQFTSVNTQLNSQNTSISGLNSQFASVNTQLNSQNTSISGLNSQFASVNTQLNSQNTSITGLNSQFSSVNLQLNSQNTSITGLNSRFTTLNSQITNGSFENGILFPKSGIAQNGFYNHKFSTQVGLKPDGTKICSTVVVRNQSPTFIPNGTCATSVESTTPEMAQTSATGKIEMDLSKGLSLSYSASNPVFITPQGTIKFKDNTEITSGFVNSTQLDITNLKSSLALQTQNNFWKSSFNAVAVINPIPNESYSGTPNRDNRDFMNRCAAAGGSGTANFNGSSPPITTLICNATQPAATTINLTNPAFNLGIGISNATEKLEIAGKIKATAAIFTNLIGFSNRMLLTDANGNVSAGIDFSAFQTANTTRINALETNANNKLATLETNTNNSINAVQDRNLIVFGGLGSGESIERNTSDNGISIKTGFTEKIKIENGGDVRISGKLFVGGNEVANSPWVVDGANIKFNIGGIVVPNGNATLRQRIIVGQGEGEYISGNNDYGISFVSGNSLRLKIENDGRVQIGTQKPTVNDYKLAVDGRIVCKRISVLLANEFPDYVFDKNYKRLSLPELESFITKNKHLPNMPTASEVKNNGLDLAETVRLQQEKIEELTLYMIELQKMILNK